MHLTAVGGVQESWGKGRAPEKSFLYSSQCVATQLHYVSPVGNSQMLLLERVDPDNSVEWEGEESGKHCEPWEGS